MCMGENAGTLVKLQIAGTAGCSSSPKYGKSLVSTCFDPSHTEKKRPTTTAPKNISRRGNSSPNRWTNFLRYDGIPWCSHHSTRMSQMSQKNCDILRFFCDFQVPFRDFFEFPIEIPQWPTFELWEMFKKKAFSKAKMPLGRLQIFFSLS